MAIKKVQDVYHSHLACLEPCLELLRDPQDSSIQAAFLWSCSSDKTCHHVTPILLMSIKLERNVINHVKHGSLKDIAGRKNMHCCINTVDLPFSVDLFPAKQTCILSQNKLVAASAAVQTISTCTGKKPFQLLQFVLPPSISDTYVCSNIRGIHIANT